MTPSFLFAQFRSMRSWGEMLASMEGMKTAANVAELKQFESDWASFKSMLTAFVAAYKKSGRILKDSIVSRIRMAKKKVDDMQCARDKHLLEATAKAEKLRQERVKSTIKAADGSSIAWLPVGIFKAKEDFMIHFQDMAAFTSACESKAVDWMQPFFIKRSDALLKLIDTQKGQLGRFKYHMRKSPQWSNVNEGRVWAPLVNGQQLPTLSMLITDLLGSAVNMMELLGTLAQYMDSPWLHGMREDIVFSSHTPQFTGLLICCASGRQDVLVASFDELTSAVPAGYGGDADAFMANLKGPRRMKSRRCLNPQP